MRLLHVVRSEIHDFLSSYTKEELLLLLAVATVISFILILVFGPDFLTSLLCRGWA